MEATYVSRLSFFYFQRLTYLCSQAALQNPEFIDKLDPYRMCHHLFNEDIAIRKTKKVKVNILQSCAFREEYKY